MGDCFAVRLVTLQASRLRYQVTKAGVELVLISVLSLIFQQVYSVCPYSLTYPRASPLDSPHMMFHHVLQRHYRSHLAVNLPTLQEDP